ncbi:MAG TPA: thioredoxin family protein [Armatimonadota bacterium]|jgi:thiol:disulfide interchange protein|nr:thioredoxin family protein [Armatimonadota bacterium]
MNEEPIQPRKDKRGRGYILLLFAMALVLIIASESRNNRRPAVSTVAFGTNIENALTQGQRLDKPVMVDVYTDWCTWCKKLDRDVYTRPDVAAALNDFVAVKVNPETDPEARAFAEKMKVEGYPTILFLNAKGEEVHRIGGYVDGSEFIRQTEVAYQRATGKTLPNEPMLPATGGT